MMVGMRGRVQVWAGAGIAVAALTGLVVYFARVGLDEADKLASVIGLFVAVAGLVVAIVGLRTQRRGDGGPLPSEGSAGGAPQDTGTPGEGKDQKPQTGGEPRTVRQRATATGNGRVYQAGRDQTINER
jgi:hypothetical protein